MTFCQTLKSLLCNGNYLLLALCLSGLFYIVTGIQYWVTDYLVKDMGNDEAKVQMHLAKEDVKDEWDDLEQNWDKFRSKLDQIFHDAEDASQEARETARKMGEELKSGYQNIRNKLK